MSYQPPSGYSPQPPQGDWGPPQPTKRGPLPWLIGALVVSVLAVGGLLYVLLGDRAHQAPVTPVSAPPDRSAALKEVRNTCDDTGSISLADGGRTLIIDGGRSPSTQTYMMNCALDHLGASRAIREHVATTRALDGQQTESWPGYTARWTYHPDDGLRMTIQVS